MTADQRIIGEENNKRSFFIGSRETIFFEKISSFFIRNLDKFGFDFGRIETRE